MYRIGIDLGGTNIAVGIVDEQAHIVYKTSIPTEASRGPEAITEAMAQCAMAAVESAGISHEEVLGVGIGSPGTVDPDKSMVITSNNIVMRNFPMGDYFKQFYNKPVYMNNDANCAALGEMYAGAAKGCHTAVMVTLGTGIGGGIIINGEIFGGATNAGAELGHVVIASGGRQCTCGRKGCWEAYASATALINEGKKAIAAAPESLLAKMAQEKGKVTGKVIFDALDAGDKAAEQVVEEYIHYLAEGIIDLINIFQPQVVVVGGGVAERGDALLDPVRAIVKDNCFISGTMEVPQVCKATLGNDAGIIGAAMLVK